MTAREFDIIMGIASGDKAIDMRDTNIGPNSLLRRRFDGINLIKPQHLKAELQKCMVSPEAIDIQDTVWIIILHAMSCILFVSSSEVARLWMFRVCEDIESIGTYNWGKRLLTTC